MATKLNVSENQEKTSLKVSTKGGLRTITPDDGSPYYVGARAYVTQNVDGATVTVIDKDGTTTANIYNGTDGTDGQDGADGNGIADISLTSTAGNVDTYTITYDDGTTETFNVTNGIDGQDGQDGQDGYTPIKGVDYFDGEDGQDGYTPIKGVDYFDGTNGTDGFSPIATVSKVGDTATISITDENGTTTATVTDGTDGTNGQDGDDGVGIASITKTATVGLVDTYTITYTDGSFTTYDVTNGQNGSGSVADVWVDGSSVLDGDTAKIDLTGKADVGDIPTAVSELTNDAGYITGYTETDPVFSASASAGITATDITNWNGKSDFSGDYDDLTDKPTIPSATSQLSNDSGFITSPNVVYCTCGTGTSTVAKEATIVSGSLTSLTTGAQAIVKFTYANSATNPTLKVGSTTAKNIKKYGSTAPGTSAASSWQANSCILFVYDGTNWQMCDWNNTTYSEISEANITSGTGSTTGLITGRRAKKAVETFAPVTSVNGSTGAVTITVPTDLSDLNNDMDVSDFPNDAGYLTSHQDISGKADKTDTDINATVTTLYANLGWVAP